MGLYQGFNGEKSGKRLGKTGKTVFLCLVNDTVMDIRLNEYLIKNGYLLDYTKGGIANADGSMTRFDGTVVRITKCAPAFINGKCLFDYPGCATVSLEEFKEWERLHLTSDAQRQNLVHSFK